VKVDIKEVRCVLVHVTVAKNGKIALFGNFLMVQDLQLSKSSQSIYLLRTCVCLPRNQE